MKKSFVPDKDRIYELVRKIDDEISFDDVSLIIDMCLEGGSEDIDPQEHPIVKQARKIMEERRFENDLKMITDEYPDETASSVWEFGEPFLSLVGSGLVDALTAYEAYRAYQKRRNKNKAPYIGSAGEMKIPHKEFYTPDEVDNLPESAFNDPEIVGKIRNSMIMWNK